MLLFSHYSDLPVAMWLDILIYGAPGRNRTHALALQERTSTIKDTRAYWSGERISKSRPLRWKRSALPLSYRRINCLSLQTVTSAQ